MPNLARVAAEGRVGCAFTTPPGFEAGSDVCSMSLLGYDPTKYHTGRAPLEAAAIGLDPDPNHWIFRLNFVTTGRAGTADGPSTAAIYCDGSETYAVVVVASRTSGPGKIPIASATAKSPNGARIESPFFFATFPSGSRSHHTRENARNVYSSVIADAQHTDCPLNTSPSPRD